MRCAKQLLFILLIVAVTGLARAQMQHGAPQANVLDASALAQEIAEAMKAAPPALDANSARAAPGVVVERNGASTAAKKLAAAYPANARAEVERTFGALLAMYPQVERKLSMPANELGGALALFLVTSLQAYQGRDARIEQFKTVAAQMRGILGAHAAIAQAPGADKQEMYEQLAIVGMFLDGVHEALKISPNPQIAANMKAAAKGYLELFFGGDIDRLELGAQGLLIQGARAQDNSIAPPQKPQRDAGEETATAARDQPATAAGDTQEPAPATQANAAANTRRIEAVLLKEAWGMGVGGALVLRYDAVVLYSDGWFTRDVANALNADAKILKGWRKQGADYWVPGSDGKLAKIPAKMRARPAKPQQTLAGRYASFSGLGGGATGTAMVAAYENFNFAADGTVQMDKGAGASTVGSNAPGGDVVTTSKSSGAGRYSLDGYQITLSLGDGKERQQLFYFFPDSDGAIGIGDGTYSNRAKK